MSFQAIWNDGNGQLIQNISNSITDAIGGGLHIITVTILSVPLIKRRGAGKGFLQDILPDDPNLSFFVYDTPEDDTPTPTDHTPIIAKFSDLMRDRNFIHNKNYIPIGVQQDDTPLYVELGDNTPHFLIAGASGSGKTCFLQALTSGLALKNRPEDLQLVLIDGVRRGLKPFVCLPHVLHRDIISEEKDVIDILKAVMDEIKNRIQDDVCIPKMVIVIDEMDSFFIKRKKELEPILETIVKQGRQFGVHMIIGSQRPSGDLISAHILSQMERVCLKVKLPKYSENIIESPEGAALKGKGDLLYYNDGELIRAQGYFLSPDDLNAITNKFKNMPKETYLLKDNVADIVDMDFFKRSRSVHDTVHDINSREHRSRPEMNGFKGNMNAMNVNTVTVHEQPVKAAMGGPPMTVHGGVTVHDNPESIRNAYSNGMSQGKIAQAIGRSKGYVNKAIHSKK